MTGNANAGNNAPPQGAVPLHSKGETFKWDEKGKVLEGILAGFKTGSQGGQLVHIQTPDGKEAASAPTTLLQALEGVAIGTRVWIKYTGEEKAKSGRMVKQFEVYAIPSQAGAR